MEDADTVSMPMDLNVVQHESNDRLVINEQNRIPHVTDISKLGATHTIQPDIQYATIMVAQEDWTRVKRILRFYILTFDWAPLYFIILALIPLTICPLNVHPLKQNSLYALGLIKMLGYLL